MAANPIHISAELPADLQAKAAADGKTVDELTEETLRKGLQDRQGQDRQWQDLLAYGRETGRASGYSEADVPQVVKGWRREQRGR